MKAVDFLLDLLYPPKCVLCEKLLSREETDFCHECRVTAPWCNDKNRTIPHLATWCAIWYYEGNARESLKRYKFANHRSYASAYGRLLALRIQEEWDLPDAVITWVPVSRQRKWKRGYDQCYLLAQATGKELGIAPISTLRKIRNNPPQSGISGAAARRANVLGVYAPVSPEQFAGKTVILLDDVLTTGATVSECARVLLTAGAKEVICAAVTAVHHQQKNQ